MATVSAIKAAIKDRLATISGARVYAFVPPSPQPPALCVLGPVRWRYSSDLDGKTLYTFEVGVYTSPADLGRAQTQLDAYLSPTGTNSIKAAVEGGSAPYAGRLAGTVDWARVVGGNEYGRLVDVAGSQLLYASLEVEAFG
jgi:hypothetical protein